MLKTLIALTSFTFEGHPYVPGEVFDVTPIKALALTYNKKAKFAPPGYKRRDMEAEKTPVPPPPSKPARTPRRRYRRRDMEAERD